MSIATKDMSKKRLQMANNSGDVPCILSQEAAIAAVLHLSLIESKGGLQTVTLEERSYLDMNDENLGRGDSIQL